MHLNVLKTQFNLGSGLGSCNIVVVVYCERKHWFSIFLSGTVHKSAKMLKWILADHVLFNNKCRLDSTLKMCIRSKRVFSVSNPGE